MRSLPAFPDKRRRLAAFAALLALITGQAASAQQGGRDNPTCPPNPNWSTYPEMRFTEHLADGQPVLLAEGRIDEGMPRRLEQALQTFRGNDIWIRSPGGDAEAAHRAGFMIRERNLKTRIPAGWACASACAFMFMGGIIRSIDRDGLLILSMFGQQPDAEATRSPDAGPPTANRAQDAALRAIEESDFLTRMGISRRLLTDIMYRPPAAVDAPDRSTHRCLTLEEAQRYNVINDRPPPSNKAP